MFEHIWRQSRLSIEKILQSWLGPNRNWTLLHSSYTSKLSCYIHVLTYNLLQDWVSNKLGIKNRKLGKVRQHNLVLKKQQSIFQHYSHTTSHLISPIAHQAYSGEKIGTKVFLPVAKHTILSAWSWLEILLRPSGSLQVATLVMSLSPGRWKWIFVRLEILSLWDRLLSRLSAMCL